MQPNPALIAVLITLLTVLRGWAAAMALASGNTRDAEAREGLEASIRAAERLLAALQAQAAQTLGTAPGTASGFATAPSVSITAPARRRTLARRPRNPTTLATAFATIRHAIPAQGTGPPPYPA